jgi:hypothetical protein
VSVASPAFGPMVSNYTTHWEVGLPTHAVPQWDTARARQPQVLRYSLSEDLGEDPKFEGPAGMRLQVGCFLGCHCGRRRGPGVGAAGGRPRPSSWGECQVAQGTPDFAGRAPENGVQDVVTTRLSICSSRKRRLQTLCTMMGHPARRHIVECLKHKLAGDPDLGWAAWA